MKQPVHLLWDYPEETALYIHIPFCTDRCAYCNFYSCALKQTDPVLRERLMNRYCDRLCALLTAAVERSETPFSSIFIGGGNPGIFTAERLEAVIASATGRGFPQEITIECNPEEITVNFLALFENGYANRLSMGIQSLQERHLATIGRRSNVCDPKARSHLAGMLRDRKGWQLSIDLITGIPGQTLADFTLDLKNSIDDFEPEHLSVYELTLEEGSELHAQSDTLSARYNPATLPALADIWRCMAESGYRQYEVSNFRREGVEDYSCRHNLHYWRLLPYLGIGPGAASTLYRNNRIVRIEIPPDLDSFMQNSCQLSSAIGSVEVLSTKELISEKLIMGLRLRSGISCPVFTKMFGVSLEDLFPATLAAHTAMGNLEYRDGRLSCSSEGLLILDTILVDFLLELDDREVSDENVCDLTAEFML